MERSQSAVVVAAQPGWHLVYEVESKETESGVTLIVGESIIAWRIVGSIAKPVVSVSDCGSEVIGYLRPDGIVESESAINEKFADLKALSEGLGPW